MENTAPVILLPGATGTYLRDMYPVPAEQLWGLLPHEYERLALHPNNLRYEALEPARVQPDSIFEVPYRELIQELRFNLSEQADRPVPVFPFGYDWRQPLAVIEQQFENFVDEVIERTKLIRHYAAAGYADDPKVNLVGHSMGGLVIAEYLERKSTAARVAKVVTLATPFRGSFEAVLKLTTGTASLGQDQSASREREAGRLTPALYQILPAIANGLELTDPALPHTLFDPGLWQPSIVQSISEYIRLHGVSTQDPDQQARDLFAALLAAGQAHQTRLDNLKFSSTGVQPGDWLCVAGVNSVTRVRLKINNSADGPIFDLSSAYRLNQWPGQGTPAERSLTGDGTVPFESVLPAPLALEQIVCVTPDDYGYWEIDDRALAALAGFHAALPGMDMLHRLIVRHFTGRPDPYGNTWGWPAPGVANEQWNPPLPLRNKQAQP